MVLTTLTYSMKRATYSSGIPRTSMSDSEFCIRCIRCVTAAFSLSYTASSCSTGSSKDSVYDVYDVSPLYVYIGESCVVSVFLESSMLDTLLYVCIEESSYTSYTGVLEDSSEAGSSCIRYSKSDRN